MTSSDPLLDARIYIADDDKSLRELLQAWLELAGFKNLLAASDGRQAVELITQQLPDILLLDVMMPGMDGYQVIQHVRTTYPDQFLPIILLSAIGNSEHRTRGIELGANDFVNKPYDSQELIARVRSLLAHKQAVDHLNAERARMSALLTQIGNPVIVTDTGGVIGQVNPAAMDGLGLDESILHQSLSDVFGLGVGDLLLRAQERAGTVSGVYTHRNHSRPQPLTFNVSVSPILEIGYILFWQDITALEEAARARLNVERAETRHVLETFSHYMSPALVERVLRDPDIVTRPEKREATVLFADLRGFTQLTARNSPDKVMALLNDIFSGMLDVVNAREGLVLDIVGDELMVAFNAPFPQDNPVERAIETAVELQRQFSRQSKTRQAQEMQVGLGIGINSGPVVMGHVGGETLKTYTMIGETVNIAHRLVDQADDRQIVVTSELVRQWQPPDKHVALRELGVVELKGVPDPIALSVIEVLK